VCERVSQTTGVLVGKLSCRFVPYLVEMVLCSMGVHQRHAADRLCAFCNLFCTAVCCNAVCAS
jgi:hypothetical protein